MNFISHFFIIFPDPTTENLTPNEKVILRGTIIVQPVKIFPPVIKANIH